MHVVGRDAVARNTPREVPPTEGLATAHVIAAPELVEAFGRQGSFENDGGIDLAIIATLTLSVAA
jgi:hypothetical protein